ncbi:hypothetical protein ACIQOW_17700 [Kitasatospora sp. NPDC091335]|uniref:hypothetical protein n=1 Tax=Kitasatospora sp. NPDC091335 TaxID=3364085 RepID=UPI0038026899
MSVKNSALATACCALLLALPFSLAQPAAAADGPTTPEEAATCRQVIGTLFGGFGSMLANSACVVRPADRPAGRG